LRQCPPESSFQFAPGEQLTLLTDGVVEARDKVGALFGFERSAAPATNRQKRSLARQRHLDRTTTLPF
jgi:serine phosphatase RsbU (regulator of sigma subunit)